VSNVLDRPRASARPTARAEPATSIWVRGALAAGWAVAVGVASLVVLSLVVWAADSGSTASAGGSMRFAAQLWLLAHRTPLRLSGGGDLAIPPLALTLVIGLLVMRGAAIVARSAKCVDARDVVTVAASVTLPYAVLAAIVAAVTGSSAFTPSIGAAFICAIVVGGLAALIGASRGSGLVRPTWQALPVQVRAPIEGAAAAVAVLLGAATLLAVGSLIAHAHEFGSLAGEYRSGPGEFSMVLLSVLMVPNAVLFAVGYLTGPGFAIGAGTSVGYGGTHLGAVPTFPLLAAVPSGHAPWQVMAFFIAALVLAGVAAGWRVAKCADLSVRDQLRSGLVAAATVGIAMASLVGFAGGPSGPGRLSAVGPSPWQVGLALLAEVAVVAALTILARQVGTRLRR
jgi:hypothetical protein